MEIKNQKTYKSGEVNAFIKQVEDSYLNTLKNQKARIYELKRQLEDANKQIEELKSQKELISKAITEAIKKAEEIDRVAMLKYNQEIAHLQRFHDNWLQYFDRIIKKYPLNEELIQTARLNEKIGKMLGSADGLEQQFEDEAKRLKGDYADRMDSGFSFLEALNPKEDLSAIMKDLGVLLES